MFELIGDRQGELLKLLHRSPDGMSVDALASALGITVNAVRQHLVALERDGFLARAGSKPSGGRPQHLYRLTDEAKERFPRQYSWFAENLIAAMRKQMGGEKLGKTLRAMGESIGTSLALPADADLPTRAQHIASKMIDLGYEASVVSGRKSVEIQADNCVFHKLAAKSPEVCEFDLGLLERASQTEVSHETCIVRGAQSCRFRLKPR